MTLRVIHRDRGRVEVDHVFCEPCGRSICTEQGWPTTEGRHIVDRLDRGRYIVEAVWRPDTQAPTHCDEHDPFEV